MLSMITWKTRAWLGLCLLHGFKLRDWVLALLAVFCLRQRPTGAICVMNMGKRLARRDGAVPLGGSLCAVTLLATIMLSTAFTAQAASFPANQCAADRLGSNLSCNASDVSITGMSVVGDTTSCIGGANVTLDLQMTINFAQPDRYDIGIFISNDGKTPQTRAANGGAASCTVSVLPTASPFLDLDGGPTGDICGDGNGSIGGGTGSGIHYMPNVTVPCQSLNGAGGNLYIPFVVSWDNQKTPPGDVCTSNLNPVPGTSSKCNSPTVTQGSVAVVVLPSITMTDNKTTLSSGDSTSYTVTITNTTGVSLSGAIFKDPAVTGIAVNSLSCSASGGATCPVSTVAAMQGAGITIPTMPAGSSITYTINATLTGNPSDTRTNTASVAVGSQANSASDTDIIVGAIAILPSTQSQNGAKGTSVVYNYTVYNYGASTDIISLSALSSKSWTVALSSSSVSVPAGDSRDITLTVNIPNNASVGTVDTTTITAVSGNNPSKTATATAVTTVTTILTLTPSNTGAGGAGSSVYYSHRMQSNASTNKDVSLTPSFTSGSCTGWTSALFESNKTTALSSPVTLSAYGGYKDFVLKINIPAGATLSSTCTATLTAAYTSGAANTVSVTDITTVKNLVLYEDPGYTSEQDTYPAGNNVYAKTYGLTNGTPYYYKWYDPNGTLVRTSPVTSNLVTLPDTYSIPNAGPLGTWVVQVWNDATNTLFEQTNFYVGPDHLKASYTGANPDSSSNVVIDLALHDKVNHVVPFDSLGNLVKGSPTDAEGPLMVTITVSGSAEIVSTTLANATITGQSVTGKLDSISGTATLTITDSVPETVTITPASYKSALYGSTDRDEPATVTFEFAPLLDHIQIEHTGTGLTCMPSEVTIKACANAACSSLATGSATVTLSPALGWAANPITFTGSTTASLSITSPQTVELGASAVSPVSSGATRCFIGATESCSLAFADAGFIFSASSGGAALTIPTQVAGVESEAYYLRAVKKDTSTQACEAGLTGTTSVKFAYECIDPAACYAANMMSINGSAAIARNNSGSVEDYSEVNLNFEANGSAPITLNYSDVGKIKLWVKATVNSAALTGSSNAFVVKPYAFSLSNIKCTTANTDNCAPGALSMPSAGDNPAASDADDSSFIQAGNAFSATVAAVRYDNTQLNNLGAATPNFGLGMNNATEMVALAHNLVGPTGVGSVNPVLGGTTSIARSSFSNGIATVSDLSWSEVGVITLTATNDAFLGNALTTTGTSGNVGRFIPDHFDTEVVQSAGIPITCLTGLTCPTLYNGFVYSGQAFTTHVTARNSAGNTTANYDNALGYAKAATLSTWNAIGGLTANPGGGAMTSNAVPSSSFNLGVDMVSTPIYTFPTTPVAPTDIYVRAVDTDNVTSLRGASSVEGGVKVVSGRVNIPNAYGSELLDLPMTATAQYYNGTSWLISDTDSVTSLALGLSNYLRQTGAWTTALSPASGQITAGALSFNLSKPTDGGTGSVDVNISVPDYFLTSSNVALVNPSNTARATFGIYKGNSKFIYIRELY
jgi:hypothetical protein